MNAKLKTLLLLHLLLVFYSVSGILSKLASHTEFLSLHFILLYGGVLVILGGYALGWQQILKRMPLTSAFSNKAITVVWGIIWGALFFAEPVTLFKVLGAALIIGGIVLFAHADREGESKAAGTKDAPLGEDVLP